MIIPRLAALGGESELDIVFADGNLPVRRPIAPCGAAADAGPAEQGSLL